MWSPVCVTHGESPLRIVSVVPRHKESCHCRAVYPFSSAKNVSWAPTGSQAQCQVVRITWWGQLVSVVRNSGYQFILTQCQAVTNGRNPNTGTSMSVHPAWRPELGGGGHSSAKSRQHEGAQGLGCGTLRGLGAGRRLVCGALLRFCSGMRPWETIGGCKWGSKEGLYL